MSILRMSLDAITIADLEELKDSEARETAELEFKGTLPFLPQKGQPQTADRWIEKRDRLGEYARDEILAEIVAFANADGGTLVLGVHETKDEPRRATKLEALPNCEALARRLIDASEDIIEPRLSALYVRAIPCDSAGNGYVVLRAAKSIAGPHRLRSTREFYVRRGERAAKMDVREIKDATLELARTGDRIERVFNERRTASQQTYGPLAAEPDKGGAGPLVIRATAIPMASLTIPDLTTRKELWWTGQGFTAKIGKADFPCGYPAREFNTIPNVRLRALISESNRNYGGSQRLVRADGLVEFSLVQPRRDATQIGGRPGNRFYVGWLLGVVTGTLAQTHKLRNALAWDGVEYGLEVEVLAEPPLAMAWTDSGFADWLEIKSQLPLRLPRYSVLSQQNYDTIIEAIIRDIFNSAGSPFSEAVRVPWGELGI